MQSVPESSPENGVIPRVLIKAKPKTDLFPENSWQDANAQLPGDSRSVPVSYKEGSVCILTKYNYGGEFVNLLNSGDYKIIVETEV